MAARFSLLGLGHPAHLVLFSLAVWSLCGHFAFAAFLEPEFYADNLFNLKFAAKQLQRQSKKSEKNEKAQKLKLKQAIEKGNMEGARIYAQNAIR